MEISLYKTPVERLLSSMEKQVFLLYVQMLEGKGSAWRNWEAVVFTEKPPRTRTNRWGWSLPGRKAWSLRVSCCLSSNARATSTDPLPQPPKGKLSQIPVIWQLVLLERSEVHVGFHVVLLAYQIMTPSMFRTSRYFRHQRRDPETLR